jgi:osmotically-inducible protein OsmY
MRKTVVCIPLCVGVILLGLSALPAQGKVGLSSLSISDAVEDELQMDQAVPAYNIDVVTNNGIVTLSGSVDDLLAKERAARIAKTVKGVRAVVNQVQVVPSLVRSDAEIREDVNDALLWDAATESYEIDVTVKDHRVTLSGTVNSWQERQLAEKVAKGVKGVTDVRNEILVDYEKERLDSEIEGEVLQRLRWDALVDHALIDVTVEDGEVRLTGTVGSASEKTRAIADAYVAGVQLVDASGLEVSRWARDPDLRKDKYADKSDQEILRAVEDAMVYDPRVRAFDVKTEVSDGTVTLRGAVDNLKAKRAAAQAARNTVGVVFVDNRLKVRPGVPVKDEDIENRIDRALVRHPYVDRYEIDVDVTNGVARLYGDVDTQFEKNQAEDITSRVRGVIAVKNYLSIQDYGPYVYDPYVDEWYLDAYDVYTPAPRYSWKSDAEIREEIKDELWWSPFVDSDDVIVTVDDGEATLTGTVDSWSEYYAAEENAFEGGAVWVKNDLDIQM